MSSREHLAWLMWCFNQGYVTAEDRAILTNWLLDDPATLHPADAALRPHLLAMADEVLKQAADEWTPERIVAYDAEREVRPDEVEDAWDEFKETGFDHG